MIAAGQSLAAARKAAALYMQMEHKHKFKPATGWPNECAWINGSEAIYIGLDPRQPGWKGIRRSDLQGLTRSPSARLKHLVQKEIDARAETLAILNDLQKDCSNGELRSTK